MVKGNTLHPIFSNLKYTFSISSTLEKLYRYKFDLLNKEVVETCVFKRVRNGDLEMLNYRNKNLKKIRVFQTSSNAPRYDVYELIDDDCIRGYILYARYIQANESERIYFTFEKKVKKGR